MPLILSADSLTLSRWWVDAAYAVNHDCRGHTGAGMSFGQGMAMSYSWKHKINTNSSTEAEIVGGDDSLGYILWARYFMIEQGYNMDASLLYQDNMSAILLETNWKASSSKRTKHIKVKYFFIKDKVDQGEITIKNCPTEQMWTDINTKPKQDLVFRVFRGHVMGIPADYKDSDYKGKVPLMRVVLMLPLTKEQLALQECVGERTNGAHKSALRTSTFKTSGKRVFVSNSSGKRIPVSSGKRVLVSNPSGKRIPVSSGKRVSVSVASTSSPTSRARLVDNTSSRTQVSVSIASTSSPASRARLVNNPSSRAPLKIVDGCRWSPGIYRALRLLGKTLNAAWEGAFIQTLTL